MLVSLNSHFDVVGFDISKEKVDSLYDSDDFNDIIDKDDLKKLNCRLSSDENTIKDANFFIITVPTPIDMHNNPDLSMIISATRLVGRNMTKNSIIVYESTVYPGVTEEICLPVLEKESGLTNKVDFWVGYSPERINPGDKVHNVENIVKVVAAQDEYSLDVIESVYKKIIKAGVYRAKNIRTAEAAKVIENTQRDLNIALINELAIIFSKLGLDTSEVLSAARTKWNFLDFYPGLVGGHCIGVDPYYLTFKAKEVGYHPEVILAGRKINDNMAFFIGDEILKRILNNGRLDGKIKVILFGLSFKENIKDIRNSKVPDIRSHLMQYGIDVDIIDPVVNSSEAKKEYGINLIEYEDIRDASAVVFCVAHDCFKSIDLKALRSKLKKEKPYIFDVKGIFEKEIVEKYGFNYWRL